MHSAGAIYLQPKSQLQEHNLATTKLIGVFAWKLFIRQGKMLPTDLCHSYQVCILVHGTGPALSTMLILVLCCWLCCSPCCHAPKKKRIICEWYYIIINIKSDENKRQGGVQHTFLEMTVSLLTALDWLDLHIFLVLSSDADVLCPAKPLYELSVG